MIGSIVYVSANRGWGTYPRDHGFHKKIMVYDSLGLVLRKKLDYYQVLIAEKPIWLEKFAVRSLEDSCENR